MSFQSQISRGFSCVKIAFLRSLVATEDLHYCELRNRKVEKDRHCLTCIGERHLLLFKNIFSEHAPP